MADGSFEHESTPGISCLIDVYDRLDLFDLLDNSDVVRLSQLRDGVGFASPENVRRSTGITSRRILREGKSALCLASELCECLQAQTGIAWQDYTAILLCHSHTDSLVSKMLAAELAHNLHLNSTAITAFNFGCSGFLKLLQEGVLLLTEESAPTARIALLNVETPETWHDASDRLFCGIVSAGATAAVLEKRRGLPISVIRTDDFLIPEDQRLNPKPLFQRDECECFDFRGHKVHRNVMRMNAEPVFLNGIELMLQNLRAALAFADVRAGERVLVVPHQPSGKLLKALIAAAKTEFPQCDLVNNLADFGNTISSSVPTILARLPEVVAANGFQPLQEGDPVILLAAGICMSQIDDHMSAGHACLRWQTSLTTSAINPVAALPASH